MTHGRFRGGAVLLPMVLCFVFVSAARADQAVTLEGKLSVERNGDGAVEAGWLRVVDGRTETDYGVELDDVGRRFCEDLDGLDVSVKGIAIEKEGETRFSVKEYDRLLTGMVLVSRGEGTILGAVVKDGEADYHVTLDETGRKLAESAEGKVVRLHGRTEQREGRTHVVVKAFLPTVVLNGYVRVQEDDDWNAVGACLAVEEGNLEAVYEIVHDDKGKALMRDLGWERAEVTGVVVEKGGVKWLKVCAFKRVESPPEEEEEEEEEYDDWGEDD